MWVWASSLQSGSSECSALDPVGFHQADKAHRPIFPQGEEQDFVSCLETMLSLGLEIRCKRELQGGSFLGGEGTVGHGTQEVPMHYLSQGLGCL